MTFFDLIAPLYDFFHFGKEKTIRNIKTLGDFSLSDKIVDVGGGTGRIAENLVPHIRAVFVVDKSIKMIEQCRKKRDLTCVIGDVEHLPFPDNYFDKIIVVDAFHHFQDQRQAIKEMCRVLKTTGAIIIEEFNPKRLGGRLIVILEKILKLSSTFYTPEEFKSLFEQNDLRVVLHESTQKEYYLVARKFNPL